MTGRGGSASEPRNARGLMMLPQYIGHELRSLGAKAIEALNLGAKAGDFYHDTGEGGFSPYHRVHGGDGRFGNWAAVISVAATMRVVS